MRLKWPVELNWKCTILVNVETTARHQDATLWHKYGDDRYGEPTVSSPVDVVVRWVERRGQIIGKDDTVIKIDGRVVVALDVEEGSLFRLGKVEDLPSPVADGLMEVVGFDKTADLKNRSNLRVCLIRKYKSSLPAVIT